MIYDRLKFLGQEYGCWLSLFYETELREKKLERDPDGHISDTLTVRCLPIFKGTYPFCCGYPFLELKEGDWGNTDQMLPTH